MAKNNDIHNLKILTIYSSVAYLFAYLIVYLFYNLFTAIVASYFGIGTRLIHKKLIFTTPDNSSLWNSNSAIMVFGSGTLLLVIIILVLLIIYKYYEYYERLIKIFIFWIILHCINRIIGSFIVGTIFHLYYSNVVLYWLYIDIWLRILLSLAGIALLIGIGNKTTRPLLLSARSFNFVEEEKRHFFILSQAFNSWFISSIVIFLMNLPSLAYTENFLSFTMFLIIFPTYFNHQLIDTPLSENIDEEPQYKIPWKYIIMILFFIILFRVGLSIGISF